MSAEKTKVREFVLFVDTNVIWTKEEDLQLLPGEFRRQWDLISAPGDVKLVIPDVVLLELAYQKQRQMLSTHQKARADLTRIEAALALGIPAIPEVDWGQIGHAVMWKLQEQVKTTPHCQSVAIPYEAVALRIRGIVDASLWRLAPFKHGKTEAGFRDALILETVRNFHTGLIHSDIGFLSKDDRLREAAKKEFAGATNFGLFGELEEYGKFLELARTRFAAEFLHTVREKADLVLHGVGWAKLDIENVLGKRFDLQVGKLAIEKNEQVNTLAGLLALDPRECVGAPSFHASPTRLRSVVGDNEFHWETTVVASAPYRKRKASAGLIAGAMGTQNVSFRALVVSVEWSSIVTAAQEFEGLRLLREQLVYEVFLNTEDELSNLRDVAELL